MEKISVNKAFELFNDTLSHCGLFLLDSSVEDIEYEIFEEFDSDSITFLHEKVLKILLKENLINKEIFDKSIELSTKFRELEKSQLWVPDLVKTDRKWYEILCLSDEIKEKIKKFKT